MRARRTTYADVVATLALLLSLGGVGYAVEEATVGARDIAPDAVRARHVKDGSITPRDLNLISLTDILVTNVVEGSVASPVTVTPGAEVELFDLESGPEAKQGTLVNWGDGAIQVSAPTGGQARTVTITLKDAEGVVEASFTQTVDPGHTSMIPVSGIFDDPFFFDVNASVQGGSVTVDRGSLGIIGILIAL